MRYLKILGICVAAIVGLLGISIGIAALTGAFSQKPIHISTIYFEEQVIGSGEEGSEEGEVQTQKVQSVYDIIQMEKAYTVKYEPASANDLELTVTVEGDKNIFENIPSKITAGKPFVLKPVVKDGFNVAGSVCLKITNPYSSDDCLLYVAVDVLAEEILEVNASTFKDCFTFETNRDEEYLENQNSGISQTTGVATSTSNTTFNFVTSTPKTIWVNSVFTNILDIDTGGVFPAGDNLQVSNLFREISFELVKNKSGQSELDSIVPKSFVSLNREFVKNQYGYKLDIAPTTLNEYKQFDIKVQMHRSYEIQKAFNDGGFGAFRNKYAKEIYSDQYLNPTESDWDKLRDKLSKDSEYTALCNSYYNFLDEYRDYFGAGNIVSEILNNTKSKSDIKNVIKTLDYVFVTQYQTIRILDVDVESFTIESLNSWSFNVFEEKTISIEEIIGGGLSDYALNFQLKAANTQTNLSAAEITAILENLKRSFSIEVYVKNSTDTNKNKVMGLTGAFENDGIVRKENGKNQLILDDYKDFSADQNFLTVEKDIENKAWKFVANVPSIEESEKDKIEFEILLAFKIDTVSLKGEQVSFYNFIPVSIYKTNVDGALTVESNNVMYINDATIHTEFASNIQQVGFSGINNLPGKNISVSNDLEYSTIKLFAEVESVKVTGEELNKIELSEEILATKFSFINVDKKDEFYTNKDGDKLEGYELGTIKVNKDGSWNSVEIKAINACSGAPLKLFAVLLFTDKDGNAIDRNGNIVDVNDTEVTYVVCEVSDMDEITIKATIDNFYFYTPIMMDESPNSDYETAYLIPNNLTGNVDVYKDGDVLLRNNRNAIYSSDYTMLKMVTGVEYDALYVSFDKLGKNETHKEITIDGENVTFNFEFSDYEIEEEKKSAQNNYREKMIELQDKNSIANLFEVVVNGVSLTPEQIEEYVAINVEEVMHAEFLVGVKITLTPKRVCAGHIKLSSKYNTPLSQKDRSMFGVMNFAVNSVELIDINAYSSGNFEGEFEKDGDAPVFSFNGVYSFASNGAIKNKETFYFREGEAQKTPTPSNREEIPDDVIPYFFAVDDTYFNANIPNVGKLMDGSNKIVDDSCFNVQQYMVSKEILERIADGEIIKFNDLTDDQYKNYKNNIIDASVNSVSRIPADVMSTISGNNSQIRVVFYLKSNSVERVYEIFNREFVVTMSSEWEQKWLGYIDTLNDYYQIVLIENQLPFNSKYIAKTDEVLEIKAFFEYAPNLMFTEPASTIVKDMKFKVKFLETRVEINEGWTTVSGLENTYSITYTAGNSLEMLKLVQNSGVEDYDIIINEIIDRTENKFTNNNISIDIPESSSSSFYEVEIKNSTIGAAGASSEIEIILSFYDSDGLNEYTFKVTVNPEITYTIDTTKLTKQGEYYYDSSNSLLNIMAKNNSIFEVDLTDFIKIGEKGTPEYILYKESDSKFNPISLGTSLSNAKLTSSNLNSVQEYDLKATYTSGTNDYVVYNIKVRIFPEYDIALKNVRYSNLYYSEQFAYSGDDLTNYLDYKKYNFNSGVYESITSAEFPSSLMNPTFDFEGAITYLNPSNFKQSYYNNINIYKMFIDSVGNNTDAYSNLKVSVDSNNKLTFTNFEQENLSDQADKDMGLLIPVKVGLTGFSIDGSILVMPAFLYNLEFNETGLGFDSYEVKKQDWRIGEEDKNYNTLTNEYNLNNIVLDVGTYALDRFFNFTYDKNLVADQSDKYIVVANYKAVDNEYYSIENSKLTIKQIPVGGLNITLEPTITIVDNVTYAGYYAFGAQKININVLNKVCVNLEDGYVAESNNNIYNITTTGAGTLDGEYSLSEIFGDRSLAIVLSNEYIEKYSLDSSKLKVEYSAVGEGIEYSDVDWKITVQPNSVGYAVLKAEVKYDGGSICVIEFRFKVGVITTPDV